MSKTGYFQKCLDSLGGFRECKWQFALSEIAKLTSSIEGEDEYVWHEICWLAGSLAGWLIFFGSGCGQVPAEDETSTALANPAQADAAIADRTGEQFATAADPAPDPFGLADKNTRQLDDLLADVKPPGTTYYNLSAEDRAYFDALAKARARRFGQTRTKRHVPDPDKAYQGAYANPAKDPNPKPSKPPPASADRDAGGQP